MRITVIATVIFVFMCSANANAGECGYKYEDDNITAIARELASKALDEHKEEFEHPTPIKKRKMPWTLSTKEDLQEFIEDILRKKSIATRDGQTKLQVTTKDISKSRIKFWENRTGTFVVYDPDHDDCGTAHRPSKGQEKYDSAT